MLRIIKNDWTKIGFVPGHGTTTELQFYTFVDESVSSGKYQYRLKQIDYDGTFEYSDIVEVVVDLRIEFSLEQNYPNPFNPATKIKYTIPANLKSEMSNVSLIIFDVLSIKITSLVNEEKPAGIYEVEWDATGLPSGIYFYQLKTESYIETKKMLLLK